MQELLRDRRGDGGVDVPSLAAQALDEPNGPTETQAATDCLGILLAGVDTTATALTWALLELSRRIDEAERLREEALAADGDPKLLPASRAVFAETLRLYPPSWYIGRRARDHTGAGGVDFAPGSVALTSPYVIQRDDRFHAEPARFDPERWRDGELRRGPAYLPFGAGPRQCLGERLAWLEGTLVLSAITRRWRLEPIDPRPPRLSPTATLAPSTPARLIARAW
jgi:cytochrome P450